MFLEKYVDEFYFTNILNTYKEEFLLTLDEENFIKIYNLFKKNKFDFIEDIILKYLEIFTLDYNKVNNKLNELKNILGENYQSIISNDMKYLYKIIEN